MERPQREILHKILDMVIDITEAGGTADFCYISCASSCTVLVGEGDEALMYYGYEDLPFSETFEDLENEIKNYKEALND